MGLSRHVTRRKQMYPTLQLRNLCRAMLTITGVSAINIMWHQIKWWQWETTKLNTAFKGYDLSVFSVVKIVG